MDINKAFISLLGILLIYGTYKYWTTPPIPSINSKTPWGQQVGRSKQIQSKTGDASMFIQKSRRDATKNGGVGKNFMEATIDYHFISRVCICPPAPNFVCCCGAADGGDANVSNIVYDGGNANMGGFDFDGGNA